MQDKGMRLTERVRGLVDSGEETLRQLLDTAQLVRLDRERALGWSVEEVLKRWTALFTGPLLVVRYLSAARAEMTAAEIARVEAMRGIVPDVVLDNRRKVGFNAPVTDTVDCRDVAVRRWLLDRLACPGRAQGA